MRGDFGEENDPWRIAGSGRLIEQMKAWEVASYPQDWRGQLGQSFLDFVKRSYPFDFYLCPGDGCDALI